MAVNVRCYGFQGLAALPIIDQAGQNHADSVYAILPPYVWAQLAQNVGATAVTLSFSTATRTDGSSNDRTSFMRIEVQDGQTIRYEVNPPGRAVVADLNSPSLSGKDQLRFGANWTMSVIDASTVAS